MRRLVLLAALGVAAAANGMPLGLRTAAWGIAPANRRAAVEAVFPALGAEATAGDVAAALNGAADGALADNIADAGEYAAFREWAKYAGAAAVKSSGTAWLSFAVGAPGLVPPPQEGDLVIDDVAVAPDGRLKAVFSLDGVDIGSDAVESRLKTVFSVEGATTLQKDAFSGKDIGLSLAPTGDGRVRARVTPPTNAGNTYFMRVKMK